MWILSCPSIICWKDYSFSTGFSWRLFQKLVSSECCQSLFWSTVLCEVIHRIVTAWRCRGSWWKRGAECCGNWGAFTERWCFRQTRRTCQRHSKGFQSWVCSILTSSLVWPEGDGEESGGDEADVEGWGQVGDAEEFWICSADSREPKNDISGLCGD